MVIEIVYIIWRINAACDRNIKLKSVVARRGAGKQYKSKVNAQPLITVNVNNLLNTATCQ